MEIYQVTTKEVNTQKSKLNYCLKPLLALLISLSRNFVVVRFGMKTESKQKNVCPPKFMLI